MTSLSAVDIYSRLKSITSCDLHTLLYTLTPKRLEECHQLIQEIINYTASNPSDVLYKINFTSELGSLQELLKKTTAQAKEYFKLIDEVITPLIEKIPSLKETPPPCVVPSPSDEDKKPLGHWISTLLAYPVEHLPLAALGTMNWCIRSIQAFVDNGSFFSFPPGECTYLENALVTFKTSRTSFEDMMEENLQKIDASYALFIRPPQALYAGAGSGFSPASALAPPPKKTPLEDGDLAYGLSNALEGFLTWRGSEATKRRIAYLNNSLHDYLSECIRHSMIELSTFFEPLKSHFESQLDDETLELDTKNHAKRCLDFRSFAATLEATMPNKQRHLTREAILADVYDPEKRNPFILTYCKFGILWALSKGKHVYFVVDGFDDNPVFKKQGNSYTDHEYRLIYRLMLFSKTKYPELQERIHFYKSWSREASFMTEASSGYRETSAPFYKYLRPDATEVCPYQPRPDSRTLTYIELIKEKCGGAPSAV